MRDVIKSALSLGWATSLFGLTQAARLFEPAQGFTGTTPPSNAGPPRDAGTQRTTAPSREPHVDAPLPSADPGRLDISRFVVIGEGLAAGVASFGLNESSQRASFPVQAAARMGAPFLVPYLQAPGIAGAPGFRSQPVILPALMQTTVVNEFPLRRRHQHLAMPGYEVADCLFRRPAPPLVHRGDATQTIANLVLGLPTLTTEPAGERQTQLEYTIACRPTLVLVALGYAEALRAALGADAAAVPAPSAWARDYERIVAALRETGAALVLATVPDPAHTAACQPLTAAARVLRVDARDLAARYRLDQGDCLTIRGLVTIAGQLLGGSPHAQVSTGVESELGTGAVISRTSREAASRYVQSLNDCVTRTARQHGASILALDAIVQRVREHGLEAGGRVLTADLLGGFYTLNGCYPGAAGHAAIANELLRTLNETHGARFAPIDVASVAASDATADYTPAAGGIRKWAASTASTTTYERADGGSAIGRRPAPHDTHATNGHPRRNTEPSATLKLPPSMEMRVPLCRDTSYHGDAIRVVDCTDPREAQFGSAADVLFGGPVLFDSHLSGSLHIRFFPIDDRQARFELRFEPLAGEDGVLSAPMFFRWPVTECRIVAEPGTIASGTLDLHTGESHDLTLAVRYLNSALQALVAVNPAFPDQPIVFPGQYGSAWALFQPREDGDGLDFTFYGSTFLPLGGALGGRTVRWALPFAGEAGTFASMPARGLAMHPHLQLSTRSPGALARDAGQVLEAAAEAGAGPIDLPHNALTELTLVTRRSSFGDRFALNSAELGGPATGRSHLLGRLLVQTGEPFGDTLPVVVSLAGPGGVLGQTPPSPLSALFPGRLSPGPVGHDEFLRFPTRNYFLDAVTLVDDPFDLSVGAVDLRTGRFLNQLLHRGFIGQDLFFSLIRVEPRTPRASFLFRGPAAFERSADGGLLFRLQAIVRVPYPTGFLFPAPDLTTAITVGEGSVLDPYVWLRASADRPGTSPNSITRQDVRSSTGESFSYRLELSDKEQRPAMFEYVNHAQGGRFRLETLAWLGRTRLDAAAHGAARHGGHVDVVTFSGFGRWSKDPTGRAHQVAAQIATGAEEYVSIQIDGGQVSNVNTRPADELAALP